MVVLGQGRVFYALVVHTIHCGCDLQPADGHSLGILVLYSPQKRQSLPQRHDLLNRAVRQEGGESFTHFVKIYPLELCN